MVTVPPPEPPPPLPPEPARLSVVAPPVEVCKFEGAIGEDALELAGRPDGPGMLIVSSGRAKVTIGPGGVMFADVATPGLSVRGLVVRSASSVRTTNWVSFGGVYFPGASAAVNVKDARDGKIEVTAQPISGFTLADGSRSAELPCASASLGADSAGTLARDLPQPFQAHGAVKQMFFKAKTPVPISGEPAGPVGGTFDANDEPVPVTVLETRGARARVRKGHVAGWVDTKLLVAPTKASDARLQALIEAAQFGVIGTLSSGSAGAPPSTKTDESAPLVCPADVRVVAELSSGSAARERTVVGAIPAGKPVRVRAGDKSDELVYLVPGISGAMRLRGGARLAVPARDLAACTPGAGSAAPDGEVVASAPPQRDAIDTLDPEPMFGDAIGDSFGAGGIGLSGVGEGAGRGEGIGLGNIGTLGHGSGTGSRGHSTAGAASSISIRQGATQVNGRLPPEVIQRIVRQNFGRFRLCYENGLRTNPALQGRVAVKFVIDEKGNVKTAGDGGSDLPDIAVVSCVVRGFGNLSFPQPEGGIVTVVYPIIFNPGEPAKKPGSK